MEDRKYQAAADYWRMSVPDIIALPEHKRLLFVHRAVTATAAERDVQRTKQKRLGQK